MRPELSLSIDFSTVADIVNDDYLLVLQDLEDDSVGTFANLVETFQFTLEGVEFRRIKIFGKPLNSISDPFANHAIDVLQLSKGGFENADGIHWSDSKTLANFGEVHPTFAFGDSLLLSKESLANVCFQRYAFVGITKQFDQFLLDDTRKHLSKFFFCHLSNTCGHSVSNLLVIYNEIL